MFERTWTVVAPTNAGPVVFTISDFALPDYDVPLEIEAWRGDAVNGNVYLVDGDLDLASAQAREGVLGRDACLMVVPHDGVAGVRVPGDMSNRLTVYFDSAAVAVPQTVSVRLRECRG